jgi:hypothetical protein
MARARLAEGRADDETQGTGPRRESGSEATKAALKARQPDLLDLLTEKPKAARAPAKKEKPASKG